MKSKTLLFFVHIFGALLSISCSNDSDICTGEEATPRLKIKFRTTEGKVKTLDSLYLNVTYNIGEETVIRAANVDSILVPLRIDDKTFTDISVRLSKEGPSSKIQLNYTTESQYVSPACGIRRLYKNFNPTLQNTNPVTEIIKVQNEIVNEEKSHLYLVF